MIDTLTPTIETGGRTWELRPNLPDTLDLFVPSRTGAACFHTRACHAAHRQGSDDSGWVIGIPTEVVEAAFVGWQESTYFGFCQLCTIRSVTR